MISWGMGQRYQTSRLCEAAGVPHISVLSSVGDLADQPCLLPPSSIIFFFRKSLLLSRPVLKSLAFPFSKNWLLNMILWHDENPVLFFRYPYIYI